MPLFNWIFMTSILNQSIIGPGRGVGQGDTLRASDIAARRK
jgi:hypothetical protein